MWRAGMLIVAALATTAYADPADPDDPRDAFGFKKKKPKVAPLDCSDARAFGCAGAASDPLADEANPYTLGTWLPAKYLINLPVGDASHDAVAHYAVGVGRDDAGPSMGGATGLENRWTLHGAPIDGMRTGAADTRIPLLFLDGMFVSPGGFAARDRVSTGGVIDARLRGGTKTHEVELRAWAGYTAPARQRAIVRGTYQIRRGELDLGPEGTVAAVATGPLGELLGGTAWYAAGVATEISSTKFRWNAGTVVDADGDMIPDGFPGNVQTEPVDSYKATPVTLRVPLMLRGGLDRGVHHFDVSLVGAVGTDVRYLYNSTLQAAGVNGRGFVGDAVAQWRGTWKHTRARAQVAWHRAMRRESARDPAAANIPQLLSAYVPETLADDPELAARCADDVDGDRYPEITNCPVPVSWFASGGAGPLTDTTGDRPSLTADLAHRIGNNVVRVGATGEDTRLVTETRFTGGTQIRSLFPGHASERRFADPDALCNPDAAQPCPTVDTSELRWRTRYTAAYVEDTWQAAPNISVNGGVRWELMWVGTALHHSDQFAPRLGLSWAPRIHDQIRSRVWASMGRSYAQLPAGVGQTIIQRDRTVDRVFTPAGEGRAVDLGSVYPVGSGVEPIAQDELTAGAQFAFARTLAATVWLQGRWLRRGLDTTVHGFDNPGRYGGTPALRETTVVGAELSSTPVGALVLRAGYMYGRTIGSWTGAFDPREGAVLYAGSDYDATSVNLLGRLPTDMGHRTYIEAGSQPRSVGSAKLSLALRLTAGSGRPRSAIADSLDGIIHLIPRGSMGRGPMVTQANVRVAARWQGLDITLDLFNAFNRREATSVDELYVFDDPSATTRPIDRGTAADLPFLKTENGTPPRVRPGFQSATQFQSPLAVVLGIRTSF